MNHVSTLSSDLEGWTVKLGHIGHVVNEAVTDLGNNSLAGISSLAYVGQTQA